MLAYMKIKYILYFLSAVCRKISRKFIKLHITFFICILSMLFILLVIHIFDSLIVLNYFVKIIRHPNIYLKKRVLKDSE